jgi:hypothetical protein
MAKLRLQIYIVDDSPEAEYRSMKDMLPFTNLTIEVTTREQAEQIAREMQGHFDQVAAENHEARAVADALAHPEAQEPKFSGLAMTTAEFQLHLARMASMGLQVGKSMDRLSAAALKKAR